MHTCEFETVSRHTVSTGTVLYQTCTGCHRHRVLHNHTQLALIG